MGEIRGRCVRACGGGPCGASGRNVGRPEARARIRQESGEVVEPRRGLDPGECYCLVSDGGEGEEAGHCGLQTPARSWIWCGGQSTALILPYG